MRISDELWAAAQEIADEDGVHRSDVLRVALERYVRTRRKARKKKD